MRPALLPYGWDEGWAQRFDASAEEGQLPARVLRVDRGALDAAGPQGPLRVAIPPRSPTPATGDWIVVAPGPAHLAAILERRTLLARKAAGDADTAQPIAANIGGVVIVLPLDRPPNPHLRDRLLVLAWDSGAAPVLVYTKLDLATGERLAATRQGPDDVDVLRVSTVDGTGLDDLAALVAARGTVALLGPSGAGKSTLVNALLGAEVQRTGSVRDFDRKGRHTTSARELRLLPRGGALIDTPGLRAVGLLAAEEGLGRRYPQIAALAETCHFADCGHDTEPGCAIKEALEDGRLDPGDVAHWRALHAEEEALASRRAARPSRRGARPPRGAPAPPTHG